MSHYTKETFFSEEGWRRLLADAGFAVEEDSSWLFSGKNSEACEVQHLFRTRKVEKQPLLGPYPLPTAESFMNYLKVKDMETIADLMEPIFSILTLGVPNNGVQGLGSKTEEFDGPVEDLPFSTGSFDAVLSAWKLDSASSLEKPVGELVRVADTSSRQAQVVLLQGAPDSEVLKLLRGVAPAPFLNHQGSLLHSASNILADHSFGNLSFRRIHAHFEFLEQDRSERCKKAAEVLAGRWHKRRSSVRRDSSGTYVPVGTTFLGEWALN
ncbi:hypothetical protein BDV23DRAFT_179263 [Aspergillus alliaceus]|uniref:Methyltransferase type 11 domain-containing protein n=1 Tax=Petromyces alliaceus TaxID=209559 RepID=A0A5N7CL01_PETAA|nr:hypothetical protein BDV23DRAFT_179263 [Aspergillus alliaceus]